MTHSPERDVHRSTFTDNESERKMTNDQKPPPNPAGATARPWNLSPGLDHVIYAECIPIVHCSNGDGMDWIPGKRNLFQETAKANAALIVESVNSHAALTERVRELEGALRWIVSQKDLFFAECQQAEEILSRARAALGGAK